MMATPRENRKKQARSEANMLTASDRPIEVAIWFIGTSRTLTLDIRHPDRLVSLPSTTED
jgi:hypothetical protein